MTSSRLGVDCASDIAHVMDRSAPLSPLPPLPASVTTLALWHSETGIAASPVQTWTDAVSGIAFTQATLARRPLLAADSTHFAGRQVVQTDVANSRYTSTGVLGAPLIAAGSKPWIYSVMRCRSTTGVADQRRCYQCGDGGGGGNYDISMVLDVPSGVKAVASASNANQVAGASNGILTPHFYAHGINAAGKNELVVDGVSAGVVGSGLTASACSLLSVGCYIGPDQFNDLSLALLMLCSARPTGPEEAAILAWSRAYYGTP